MRINWGALGITIGLVLVAASILAMGLMVGRRISVLEKNIPIILLLLLILRVMLLIGR